MQFLLLSLQTKLRCRSLCVHFFIIWEFAEFWSNCLSLSLVLIEAPALLSSRTITHTRILHTQLSSSYSAFCLFWEISRRHNNIVTCEKWCQFLFGWSSRDRWHFSTFSGQFARLHFFCRSLNFYCFLLLCGGMLLWGLCASFAQSSLHVYSAKER